MVQEIARRLLGEGFTLSELSPEASARRYFRVHGKQLLIVTCDQGPATACQEILTSCNIYSPTYGNHTDGGYLIEDCCDIHLSHAPTSDNYRMLIEDWHKFSRCALAADHPNYDLALDADLFRRELKQFVDSYLIGFKKLAFSEIDLQHINDLCAALARDASFGPQCLQHRDFHCRNIMLHDKYPRPTWIDFQDMRRGPIFYDLASLYTDAYLDLNDEVFGMIIDAVEDLGDEHEMHAEDVHPQFQVTALQRVLKALGTFGLLLNNGRGDYADAERRASICAIALLDHLPDYYDLRKYLC
ncbi:MAG: phosphotransferase [Planctomycetota bacterium]